MTTIIEKILNQVSVDPRVKDGVFEISCNEHMEALRDYLTKKGIPTKEVVEFSNKVLEGKYPERQAYNKDGLLVTFPTPEYKQRAIQRGTHFEKKPAPQTNLFGQPPEGGTPTKEEPPKDSPGAEQKPPTTSLPISSVASEKPAEVPATPEAPAPTNVVSVDAPAAEPEPEPTKLPPPEPKSSAEKKADSTVIKKILQSDDSLLQEVSTWIENNGPQYILDALKNHPKS